MASVIERIHGKWGRVEANRVLFCGLLEVVGQDEMMLQTQSILQLQAFSCSDSDRRSEGMIDISVVDVQKKFGGPNKRL